MLKKFIERYFFKTRYIFHYDPVKASDDSKIKFFSMTDADNISQLCGDTRLGALLKRRQGSSAWYLFIIEDADRLIGYSFLHIPRQIEWSDSLPTRPTEARISSLYVDGSARGQGLAKSLVSAQLAFCRERELICWSVVERQNVASCRAMKKSGGVVARKNYLLKLWGRNVISFVTSPYTQSILLGSKRARR